MKNEQRKIIERREAAVLAGLQGGLSNKQIADRVGVTEYTVKKDVSVLLRRYQARDRVSLVVSLWKAGQDKLGAR